jgi:hypothetical protein
MANLVYAGIFDDTSDCWSTKVKDNDMYISAMESYFNDRLNSRGHVFLNEIYDAFRMSRTSSGAIFGWFKEEGSLPIKIVQTLDSDGSYLLEFEVDGVIYHRLADDPVLPRLSDVEKVFS